MRFNIASLRKCSAVKASQTDSGDVRLQQVTYNGKSTDAQLWMPYGMSANVAPGSLCLYAQIGGDGGELVIFPDRSQDRVKGLKSGEVALFNPLTQSRTIYRKNGDIEEVVTGENGTKSVTIKKDWTVVVGGDVSITTTGKTDIVSTGDVNITASTINLN